MYARMLFPVVAKWPFENQTPLSVPSLKLLFGEISASIRCPGGGGGGGGGWGHVPLVNFFAS